MDKRAIGAYIFAGGLGVGVREHFDIDFHLEDGPFGVSVAEDNGFKVHTPKVNWPSVEELRNNDASFYYANTPCTVFCAPGGKKYTDEDILERSETACLLTYMSLMREVQPPIFCWELTPRIGTRGRFLIEPFNEQARALGYKVYEYWSNAALHGCPQSRFRYHWIASKYELEFPEHNFSFANAPTVESVLYDVEPREDELPYLPLNETRHPPRAPLSYAELWKYTSPWGAPRTTYNDIVAVPPRTPRGTMIGQVPFVQIKSGARALGATQTSSTQWHPYEPRIFASNETAALMGFKPDFNLDSWRRPNRTQVLARGVTPSVGERLGQVASLALDKQKTPVDNLPVTVNDCPKSFAKELRDMRKAERAAWHKWFPKSERPTL